MATDLVWNAAVGPMKLIVVRRGDLVSVALGADKAGGTLAPSGSLLPHVVYRPESEDIAYESDLRQENCPRAVLSFNGLINGERPTFRWDLGSSVKMPWDGVLELAGGTGTATQIPVSLTRSRCDLGPAPLADPLLTFVSVARAAPLSVPRSAYAITGPAGTQVRFIVFGATYDVTLGEAPMALGALAQGTFEAVAATIPLVSFTVRVA